MTNSARILKINWQGMKQKALSKLTPYSKIFEDSFYRPEYLKKLYPTEEIYKEVKSAFSTWAVLDNTGWHEPGNMGWWGASSAEPADESKWSINWEKTFITQKNKNKYITIVDCHI